MQIRLEPPPVYFMHVPKTAGTALGSWLRAGYRAQDYIDLDIPQVLACPPERLSRIRCYHSWHHGRGMYDWLGRPDLPVVTVLRDPIERTVSHFEQHRRHLERHPELFHESYLASMAGLLGGGIEACDDLARVAPTQAGILGNRRDYRTFFEKARASGSEAALRRPFGIRPIPWPAGDREAFEAGCAWLREMPVVGLTERFGESVLLIADLLGIPPPAASPRANVNPRRPSSRGRYADEMTPKAMSRVREHCRFDLELYGIATEMFERQWAAYRARPRRVFSLGPHLRELRARVRRVVPVRARRGRNPS